MTSSIWWLIGTLGVGGLIGLVLVFTGLWPVLVSTRIGRFVLVIATAGIALVAFYFKARAAGEKAERNRQEKKDDEFLAHKKVRDAGIDGLSRDELERMLRDGK